MYEAKHQPLLSPRLFCRRLLLHGLAALALFAVSLLIGTLGYVYFEAGQWHDGLLNAALMLGGLGPTGLPLSVGGKLFIAGFGLYSGLMFVGMVGLTLAPVLHRLLHRFHLERE